MQLFTIYFSTLTFLLIELIGLIKGDPIGSILLKSLGAFAVLFSLGTIVTKLFESMAKTEDEADDKEAALKTVTLKGAVSVPGVEQPAVATVDAQTEMYKQEAIRLAREKPKEVAQMFEALINK
jgi:hypothetical protein